jgi:cyclase
MTRAAPRYPAGQTVQAARAAATWQLGCHWGHQVISAAASLEGTYVIEEIAAGIFTSDHPVADGKNGIVFGERVTLCIDTGNGPDDGRRMVELVRAQGRRADWLALTHAHADHVLGGSAFGESLVFGHALVRPGVERELPRLAERLGVPEAAARGALPWPVVTFTQEIRLDMGGRHARLFHAPGHSPDSSCVLVEEDGVLFGGDTAVTGIVPAFGSGSSRALEATLRLLADVPAAVLVPGHGPVLRGRARIREWLAWMAEYIAGVRRYVEDGVRAGQSEDELAEQLDFDSFIQGRLEREPHGMVRRHQNTARALFKELRRPAE